MSDCAMLGHPLVDGVKCPCGTRAHASRRAAPPLEEVVARVDPPSRHVNVVRLHNAFRRRAS